MIKIVSRLSIAACMVSWCSGCAPMQLLAVNVRAAYVPHTRLTDVAYGTEPRNKLDVYMPNKSSAEHAPVPMVVFIHGGGWFTGGKAYHQFVGAGLAAQGYVAVVPNYRLYPKVKAPAVFEDVAAAVVFAHDHALEWGADPTRLYVVGHSAGAHLAVMLALNRNYLQHAGASPDVMRGVVGLDGPYDFLPFPYKYLNDFFGPPENFAASQPINFVRSDAPPLLLIHGLKDNIVNPNNTRSLTAAMQAVGGRVHAEYFPNADHYTALQAFSPLTRHPVPVLQEIHDFIYGDDAVATPTTASSAVVAR